VNILVESTPPHVNLGEIQAAMTSIPGDVQAHDLHVWTLTSRKYAMSGHETADHQSTSPA
jgi:cobalt-zinc-cadmium efflux system protein